MTASTTCHLTIPTTVMAKKTTPELSGHSKQDILAPNLGVPRILIALPKPDYPASLVDVFRDLCAKAGNEAECM